MKQKAKAVLALALALILCACTLTTAIAAPAPDNQPAVSAAAEASAAAKAGQSEKKGWPTWKVAACAAAAIFVLSIIGFFINRTASGKMKALNDQASDKGDSQSKNNDTEEK